MRLLEGFAPLAEAYDGFIVDLWGVVHDGVAPYPGAIETLANLKRLRKRVVLLSNAPRRAEAAAAAMRAMGIGDELYDAILTSGEAVHRALRDRTDPWFARLAPPLYHLGPARDRNVFDTLGLPEAGAPEEAGFVLNTGPDDHLAGQTLEQFLPLLRRCLAAGLPMICANPDLEVIRGGVRVLCAGALAEAYAELGGEVRSLGKPDPAIYDTVLALLGLCDRTRVLAVGDSLRTDIAGAKAAGIESAWVIGGIHAAELGAPPEGLPPAAVLEAAVACAGLAPAAALAAFRW